MPSGVFSVWEWSPERMLVGSEQPTEFKEPQFAYPICNLGAGSIYGHLTSLGMSSNSDSWSVHVC